MRIRAIMHVKNHELEERRKALNVTLPQFAQHVDISVGRYRRIETMKVKPTEDEALKIAIALKCPDDVLFPEGYENIVQIFSNKLESIADYTPPLLSEEQDTRLLEQLNARMTIDKLTRLLSPKELKVISLRYGLKDNVPLTYEEVGKEMGVTRERIRQIEAKALEQMRFGDRSLVL